MSQLGKFILMAKSYIKFLSCHSRYLHKTPRRVMNKAVICSLDNIEVKQHNLAHIVFQKFVSLGGLCTSIPGINEIGLQNCGNTTSNTPRTLTTLWVAPIFPLLWSNMAEAEDKNKAATYYRKEVIQMEEGKALYCFYIYVLFKFSYGTSGCKRQESNSLVT